jgi:hypothetical protein
MLKLIGKAKQKVNWQLKVDKSFFETGETLSEMAKDKQLQDKILDILTQQAPGEFKQLNRIKLSFDKDKPSVLLFFIVIN